MLNVDENIAQKQVKDIEHLNLVLEHIPTKELYGLQVSVMQEVQSRSREDVTNLEISREVKDILQVTCEQITLEKEEERQCVDKLEKQLTKVYNNISNYAQEPKVIAEEKIQKIVQPLERYKQKIAELVENFTPRTPLEVMEEREKEFVAHIDSIEKEEK
jgi:hypothetical protein